MHWDSSRTSEPTQTHKSINTTKSSNLDRQCFPKYPYMFFTFIRCWYLCGSIACLLVMKLARYIVLRVHLESWKSPCAKTAAIRWCWWTHHTKELCCFRIIRLVYAKLGEYLEIGFDEERYLSTESHMFWASHPPYTGFNKLSSDRYILHDHIHDGEHDGEDEVEACKCSFTHDYCLGGYNNMQRLKTI